VSEAAEALAKAAALNEGYHKALQITYWRSGG
jgi:hypothetical protein